MATADFSVSYTSKPAFTVESLKEKIESQEHDEEPVFDLLLNKKDVLQTFVNKRKLLLRGIAVDIPDDQRRPSFASLVSTPVPESKIVNVAPPKSPENCLPDAKNQISVPVTLPHPLLLKPVILDSVPTSALTKPPIPKKSDALKGRLFSPSALTVNEKSGTTVIEKPGTQPYHVAGSTDTLIL